MSLYMVFFELRRRWVLLAGAVVGLGILLGFTVWSWTFFEDRLSELEQLFRAMPEDALKLFVKGGITTFNFDVYYLFNFHVFTYVAILGALFAYMGSNIIVGELQSRTLWIPLSSPLPRWRIVTYKYLALLTFSSTVSLATPIILYPTARLLGVELGGKQLEWYFKLYLTLIPFYAAVTALGILLAAIFADRTANIVAPSLVIAMYLIDALTLGTRLEWLGKFSITRYHDALRILVRHQILATHIVVLTLFSLVVIMAAVILFSKRDITIG